MSTLVISYSNAVPYNPADTSYNLEHGWKSPLEKLYVFCNSGHFSGDVLKSERVNVGILK